MDGWGALNELAKVNHSALWTLLSGFVGAAINPRAFFAVSAVITAIFIITH